MGAVVALVVLLLLFVVVFSYNRFVRQRTLVDESWGGIDVELTRRHDLIPNLVETVRGYATHERAVLETLVAGAGGRHRAPRRPAATAAQGFEDQVGRALQRGAGPGRGLPRPEGEPGLPRPAGELTLTEDRIAAARRFYNGNVRAYNTRVRTFPSNLVAAIFRFQAAGVLRAARTRLQHPCQVSIPSG